jgi:vancomycin aglycone glucosyltransferase
MDEDMGHDVRVVVDVRGGDVGPLVGLAVRLRALGAEVRVCASPPDSAERPADSSEERQPEMRTCPTRGSTEFETPVIRPASAGPRSTAASEVSR